MKLTKSDETASVSAVINLTVRYPLPCGCTLQQTLSSEVVPPVENIEGWIAQEGGKLAYWFKDRAPRHRCELVSTENPNGIQPR